MAASERPGRQCGCGCGRDIGHMHPRSIYHSDCKVVRTKQIRKDYEQRKEGHLFLVRKNEALRTPNPFNNFVKSREPNRPQKLCPLCCGMPWARLSDRLSDVKTGLEPVADEGRMCRGCGEAYAPEPKPEPVNVLGSSAAMAVREGQWHGAGSVEPSPKIPKRGVNKYS